MPLTKGRKNALNRCACVGMTPCIAFCSFHDVHALRGTSLKDSFCLFLFSLFSFSITTLRKPSVLFTFSIARKKEKAKRNNQKLIDVKLCRVKKRTTPASETTYKNRHISSALFCLFLFISLSASDKALRFLSIWIYLSFSTNTVCRKKKRNDEGRLTNSCLLICLFSSSPLCSLTLIISVSFFF